MCVYFLFEILILRPIHFDKLPVCWFDVQLVNVFLCCIVNIHVLYENEIYALYNSKRQMLL